MSAWTQEQAADRADVLRMMHELVLEYVQQAGLEAPDDCYTPAGAVRTALRALEHVRVEAGTAESRCAAYRALSYAVEWRALEACQTEDEVWDVRRLPVPPPEVFSLLLYRRFADWMDTDQRLYEVLVAERDLRNAPAVQRQGGAL